MSHELTLHLHSGLTLRLRAMHPGITWTLFAHKGLQQRVVHDAVLRGIEAKPGARKLFLNSVGMDVTPDESEAVVAFVRVAGGVLQ